MASTGRSRVPGRCRRDLYIRTTALRSRPPTASCRRNQARRPACGSVHRPPPRSVGARLLVRCVMQRPLICLLRFAQPRTARLHRPWRGRSARPCRDSLARAGLHRTRRTWFEGLSATRCSRNGQLVLASATGSRSNRPTNRINESLSRIWYSVSLSDSVYSVYGNITLKISTASYSGGRPSCGPSGSMPAPARDGTGQRRRPVQAAVAAPRPSLAQTLLKRRVFRGSHFKWPVHP